MRRTLASASKGTAVRSKLRRGSLLSERLGLGVGMDRSADLFANVASIG